MCGLGGSDYGRGCPLEHRGSVQAAVLQQPANGLDVGDGQVGASGADGVRVAGHRLGQVAGAVQAPDDRPVRAAVPNLVAAWRASGHLSERLDAVVDLLPAGRRVAGAAGGGLGSRHAGADLAVTLSTSTRCWTPWDLVCGFCASSGR